MENYLKTEYLTFLTSILMLITSIYLLFTYPISPLNIFFTILAITSIMHHARGSWAHTWWKKPDIFSLMDYLAITTFFITLCIQIHKNNYEISKFILMLSLCLIIVNMSSNEIIDKNTQTLLYSIIHIFVSVYITILNKYQNA